MQRYLVPMSKEDWNKKRREWNDQAKEMAEEERQRREVVKEAKLERSRKLARERARKFKEKQKLKNLSLMPHPWNDIQTPIAESLEDGDGDEDEEMPDAADPYTPAHPPEDRNHPFWDIVMGRLNPDSNDSSWPRGTNDQLLADTPAPSSEYGSEEEEENQHSEEPVPAFGRRPTPPPTLVRLSQSLSDASRP